MHASMCKSVYEYTHVDIYPKVIEGIKKTDCARVETTSKKVSCWPGSRRDKPAPHSCKCCSLARLFTILRLPLVFVCARLVGASHNYQAQLLKNRSSRSGASIAQNFNGGRSAEHTHTEQQQKKQLTASSSVAEAIAPL